MTRVGASASLHLAYGSVGASILTVVRAWVARRNVSVWPIMTLSACDTAKPLKLRSYPATASAHASRARQIA